jgi:hypothetical protein
MKRTYIALMALALVVAACGSAEPAATTSGPAPSTTAAPAPATTADSGPTSSSVPASDAIVAGEPIALSPTHYVVDVESDDVLNGRYGPGVGFSVNAELDPAYGTVRVKGSTQELESGSVWTSVAYSADTQLVEDPAPYGYGWVNSHFIAPIDDWVPAGGDCDLAGEANGTFGDATSKANEVYDVIAVDLGDCIRIVVTFAESAGGIHLGATLPTIEAREIDGSRLRVDLPADSVIPHATDVFGEYVSAVVAIKPGGGFWLDIAQPGSAAVRAIAETGQIIIDIEKGDVDSIFYHDGTIVALPPLGPPNLLGFVGYGRPFEATLSIVVGEHESDAEYADHVMGSSVIVDGKAVMTGGWLEAWGIYEFRVEDLPSGVYDVIVADDGAVETGFPVVRFEVTVP